MKERLGTRSRPGSALNKHACFPLLYIRSRLLVSRRVVKWTLYQSSSLKCRETEGENQRREDRQSWHRPNPRTYLLESTEQQLI